MKGQMKMSMNVLSMCDGTVDFTGFEDLPRSACLTARILGYNRLIINEGSIRTATGKLEVHLCDGKSDDPDLYSIALHCCGGNPAVFIQTPGKKSEYIQCPEIPIPKELIPKTPTRVG